MSPIWVRSRSSSSSTMSSTTSPTTRSYHEVDSVEGFWNTGRSEDGGNLGYKLRPKSGYYPVAPHDTLQDIRSRDGPDHGGTRHPGRGPSPRGRHRRPVRNRYALRLAAQDRRQGDDLQIRHPQYREEARQGRHIHAQADLCRQRLRYARPPVDLEGRTRTSSPIPRAMAV